MFHIVPDNMVEPSGLLTLAKLNFPISTKKPDTFLYRAFCCMAESEGFEPPEGLTLRLISSQVHSTELFQLS